MLKKKIYKGKMNFSKADLVGRLSMGASGISMPMLGADAMEAYRQDFTRQKSSMNFGMFGNDPKYYDNVRDITPKPEDFVEVPFRLLSATIVGGGTWKATDFSDERILRKSAPKLDGVPLYKDHETDLDNWVGLVNGVKWTKEFTDDSGMTIPAGIDGIVAIDKVTNPKVARGVLSGAIFSNSVTVDFDWEMSHPFESEYDFFNRLGEEGSDGKMIRRIVVGINDYHESSLVWLGADPFAKAIDVDGNHKNVDISSVYSYAKLSYSKKNKLEDAPDDKPEDVSAAKSMTVNFAVDQNVLSLAQRKKESKPKNSDMKNFIAAFILTFGEQFQLKKGDNISEEQMVDYLKQLSFSSEAIISKQKQDADGNALLQSLALAAFKATEGNEAATTVDVAEFTKTHSFHNTDTVAGLITANESLNTKVTSLAAAAKVGEDYLNLKRTEAVRLYKLAVGEASVDEAVVSMFSKAEDNAVDGLLKQYAKNATAKFSGVCGDCGSNEFKFRSSIANTEDNAFGKDDSVESVVPDDVYARKAQSSMTIGRTK